MVSDKTVALFDDMVEDEEHGGFWSPVCEFHARRYAHLGKTSESASDDGYCGVKDCWEKVDYYLDFNEDA